MTASVLDAGKGQAYARVSSSNDAHALSRDASGQLWILAAEQQPLPTGRTSLIASKLMGRRRGSELLAASIPALRSGSL